MRLTTVILITAIMQVSAAGFAQKISLNKSNVSLEEIVHELRRQSGYNFVILEEVLDNAKPVSIKVTNTKLENVLDHLGQTHRITYEINNNTVTLKVKPTNIIERIVKSLTDIDVSGRVVDAVNGDPLPGATVKVKGLKQMVSTGKDGTFLLRNVQQGATLVITYTGFQQKEVVALKEMGNVPMELSVGNLDEVGVTVNTGYQKIRPEQSTGAIAQISTKEYESRISTNFLDGLANRLPGLMINNDVTLTANGSSRALFNIRGISTMSANQSPLIVVDGYPTELTLDMIDPNEIATVTVLKDAAAATVYGVRASNGVIVITRKQAAIGKPKYTFRGTVGITPSENYSRYRWDDDQSKIVSDYQRSLYAPNINNNTWNQAITSIEGRLNRPQSYYLLAQLAANVITSDQAQRSFADLESYDNADDYRELFLQSAVNQTYNFNVSGGSDKALYYITANYIGNRSNVIKNSSGRFMLSGRTSLKLTQKLSLELTTDYQEQSAKRAPVPGISSIAPYERFQNPDGSPAFITGSGISPKYNSYLTTQGLYDQLYYPLVDAEEINDNSKTINNRFTANFNYNLGKGFDLAFGNIYETSRYDQKYLASEQSSVARRYVNSYVFRNTDGTLKFYVPKGGFLRQDAASTSGYTGRVQLNYNKKIAESHSINAIMGAEIRKVINKSNRASYFGYNDETLLHQPVDFMSISSSAIRGSYNLGSGLQNDFNTLFDQQYFEDRFLSGYTNIVYSFRSRYSLTGSVRIDQSNLFGTDPKYKYKPLWSVGAAWNLHNENFMQNVKVVNQLKLRLAYGFNGNVAKMSLPEVVAQSAMNYFTSPNSQSLQLASYANSSLRWEQTQNFNVGLDYGFKRISGSIDYYGKKSTDLLGSSLIDPTIGLSPSLINKANINNRGIEFGMRADWISKNNFNWNTGIVVARNTSKVSEVYQTGDYNPQTLNEIGFVKDYPVGALFSYRWAGLDNEGYSMIKDAAGQQFKTNVKTPSNPMTNLMASESSGLTYYQGSSIPTINAGLSNRIDIGDFYIFTMVNYYGGFKTRIPRPDPSLLRPLQGAGTYWKKLGDELNTDVMGLAAYNNANARNAYNYADKYVVNGDYMTLGDLTVSYSFDKSPFVKKIGFSHFELKAQASNILTVGFNKENYSLATRSFQKRYITPTYTIGIFTNF